MANTPTDQQLNKLCESAVMLLLNADSLKSLLDKYEQELDKEQKNYAVGAKSSVDALKGSDSPRPEFWIGNFVNKDKREQEFGNLFRQIDRISNRTTKLRSHYSRQTQCLNLAEYNRTKGKEDLSDAELLLGQIKSYSKITNLLRHVLLRGQQQNTTDTN